MRTIAKLLAASALAVAFAAPAFAADPLSQQLEERNTYANPVSAGWTSNAMMAPKHTAAMHMQGAGWTPSTNVSPASMNSGLVQQR